MNSIQHHRVAFLSSLFPRGERLQSTCRITTTDSRHLGSLQRGRKLVECFSIETRDRRSGSHSRSSSREAPGGRLQQGQNNAGKLSVNLAQEVHMLDEQGRWKDILELLKESPRGSRNRLVYNAAIHSLVRPKRWEEALKLLHEMQSTKRVRPDLFTYRCVLYSCAGNAPLQITLDLYREMAEKGMHRDVGCATAVMRAYMKEGEWEHALELFEQLRQGPEEDFIDTRAYNTAIAVCNKGKQFSKSLELLADMKSDSEEFPLCKPDLVTYTMCISATVKAGKWNLGLHLFQELKAKGFKPDLLSYVVAFSAANAGAQCVTATALLQEMQDYGIQPNYQIYTSLIIACSKVGEWQKCLTYLDNMKEKGYPPPYSVYVRVMLACADSCQWESVMRLMDEIRESAANAHVKAEAYDLAIDAAYMNGNGEKVVKYIDEMIERNMKPSPLSYASAIDACRRCDYPWEKVDSLLKDMHNRGVRPIYTCYASALELCNTQHMWQEALNLLSEMQEHKLNPSVTNYGAVISACGDAGHYNITNTLLHEMEEKKKLAPDERCYSGHVCALARNGMWEDANRVLEDMKINKGLQPGAKSYAAVVSTCAKKGAWQQVVDLLQTMKNENINSEGAEKILEQIKSAKKKDIDGADNNNNKKHESNLIWK